MTVQGNRVCHCRDLQGNGTVDEACSQIGLARAVSGEKRIKRILFQIQQDLFTVGAEILTIKGQGKELKKIISEMHVAWLEKLKASRTAAMGIQNGSKADIISLGNRWN